MIHPLGPASGSTPPTPPVRPEVEALISEKTHAAQRARLAAVLSSYPDAVLKEAAEFGLKVGVAFHPNQLVVGFGERAKGLYLPAERRIVLDPQILMSPDGESLVHHEMAHALDAMRGPRRHPVRNLPSTLMGTAPTADSVLDSRLGRLYAGYQARNRVEDAVEFRDRLVARFPEGLPESHTEGDISYRRSGSAERIRFAQKPGVQPHQVPRLLAAGALLALGVATTAPLLGVAGLALGVVTALHGVGRQTVADQEGTSQAVVRRGLRATEVTLPQDFGTPQDTSWSDYAHQSDLVQEYLAEGMAALRESSPQRREALELHDPGLARYLQKRLDQEPD